MQYQVAPRARGSGFELWSWLFMRVSAVVLLVMVLVHFAIMHIFTPTEGVNFAFVAARFSTPFWRVYDLIMLFLGVLHGMNGMRVVADDYVHSRGWRLIVTIMIYTITFTFLVIGAQVILSFQTGPAGIP
jgi:succinate dehydrogenase / fumarate reductase, membrane anchor subunit